MNINEKGSQYLYPRLLMSTDVFTILSTKQLTFMDGKIFVLKQDHIKGQL